MRVGIDLESVFGRERANAFARRVAIDAPAAPRLAPEQHVLPDVEPVDELEMLVHQTDDGFGVDGALVRDDRAERDRGERRLAGAVFADQRVDLAGVQVEVDAVDGRNGAEALADAAQREDRFAHSFTGL